MAYICKFCAMLNVGNRCVFCGNRLAVSTPDYQPSPVAQEVAEEVMEEVAASVVPQQSVQENSVKQKNKVAVAGFVLSVISLVMLFLYTILSYIGRGRVIGVQFGLNALSFGVLGFIFSIIGLVKAKKKNGVGAALAGVGLGISLYWILTLLMIPFSGIFGGYRYYPL